MGGGHKAMSIFAFYFCFYYFMYSSQLSGVEASSAVPADLLRALPNHHTKECDLIQKEGWDEAILYVFIQNVYTVSLCRFSLRVSL